MPVAVVAAAFSSSSCGSEEFEKTGKKLVVIGIDGMDPKLLRQFMDAGVMPHFKALADEGTFVPLGTSNPPQSPVAWSCFITGMDPGGHGVFDFLHRDPKTYAPVSSTTTTEEGEPFTIPLPGNKQIQLPPDSEAVRQGTPFWDVLAERGVRADVYRIPAAYPIQESRQFVTSDMGTPDLQGGIDGKYAYYTSDLPDNFDAIKGGFWKQVRLLNGKTVDAKLFGPPSPYQRPEEGKHDVPLMECPFTVYVDPSEPVVHIEIEDGDSCVLEQGKWSDWLRCSFIQGPYDTHPFDWLYLHNPMGGMVKFYLQQARPELRLYCSAVNIDPRDPCMPISTPDDEAVEEMCEAIGPFYTAGLAEETKALEEGTIDDGEFIVQCDDVTSERLRMLDYALADFEDGLLFFYFSSIDLRCHMMWRHIEPGHPARDEKLAEMFGRSIEDAYVQMDKALGHVRERVGKDTTLIVLSDHGFAPYLRKVELNQWLMENGYLVVTEDARKRFEAAKAANPSAKTRLPLSLSNPNDVDRAKTRAYAVGFNAIYVNLAGREADGCVKPEERDALLDEIRGKLLALEDPARGGAKVVLRADKSSEIYHGDHMQAAPDLLVGYDRGYGASDDTALGALKLSDAPMILTDNKSRWSGNHLMAPEVVPGVFLTNRKLQPKDPCLWDVTATMLEFFGVETPASMRGKSLF